MSQKQIKIKAKQSACRRTKNRIREHGHDFVLVRQSGTEVLLRAISRNASNGLGGKEHWFGWLPITEVEVISENQ